MRRWLGVAFATTAMVLGLPGCSDREAGPARAEGVAPSATIGTEVSGSVGRIAFARFDPALDGLVTYTVNSDGSELRQLFDGRSEYPHWSPDGTEIAIFCCDNGMAAHLLDAETGDLRELPPPDPTLETHCGFAWSPDGERLACEVYGVDDPSRNGIYTIRSSDGGGLTRVTSNPGGTDIPGDYSPGGKRLVFFRSDEDGHAGIFVTRLNGTGIRRVAPRDMLVADTSAGSWSPSGNRILFVASTSPDHHKAIWVVNPDGGSLHQLPIEPVCGGRFSNPRSAGCYSPSWSPDGTKIVFTRSSPNGRRENIFTVDADGSGLFQVTNGGGDDLPDWGP